MVEEYQKALEHIFAYSYKCCAFKHGIRGDRPRISDGMPDFADPLPPQFFMNLGAPRPQQLLKLYLAETAKDPVEGVVVEEYG